MKADPADFACTCTEPHYVYRCYDTAGELIYIGVARDVAKRLLTHRRSHPDVALHTARTATVRYPDRAHALAAEAEAIANEQPRFNVRHKASAKATPTAEEMAAAVARLGT